MNWQTLKTAPRVLLALGSAWLGGAVSASEAAPAAAATAAVAALPATIDFNRDVRPILAENCFACHGPDKNTRKSGYRLDTFEGAAADLSDASGKGVVPGKPEASQILARLVSTDPEESMPPPKTGKQVSPRQREILARWIQQGAKYDLHWSYKPVQPVAVPKPQSSPGAGTFVRNDIDRFILARLQQEGLQPAPEADRATLIRRLSFDLTGLPPAPAEVEAFIKDKRPDAYARLVDRLLGSPHYGERMAVFWLDLVRYADTIGYHSDNPRDISPYRDYVIQAFNDNVPFDRFTTEQLAGDLLPNPTLWQKVATGYNRLLQTTEEGGAQAKEYEAKYAADRVRNLSTVWLASTMGCAECHDHKYDPDSMKDFYSMAAFFADVKEATLGRREAGMTVPSPFEAAELAAVERRIGELEALYNAETPALRAAQAEWESGATAAPEPRLGAWHLAGPYKGENPFNRKFEIERSFPLNLNKTYGEHRFAERADFTDGQVHNFTQQPDSVYYLYREIYADAMTQAVFSLGSDDGLKVFVNGKEVLAKDVTRPAEPDQEKVSVALKAGTNTVVLKIYNSAGDGGFYFKAASFGTPAEIAAALKKPAAARSAKEQSELGAYFRGVTPLLKETREELAEARQRRDEMEKRMRRTLVTSSAAPRTVRIKPRGNWMDDSGEVVQPQVPHFMRTIQPTGERATRLELAQWLTARDNPRTSRVFVNRLWALLFGTGLSKSLDDFGAQGELPVHPELLDALAWDFMASGWDVKYLVRQMVLSGTYRQSSEAGALTAKLKEKDPYNRLYARQSKVRLSAEFVRDNALTVAGLLRHRIGGESVKPYQPAGYWSYLNFPTREYYADGGHDQFRRGLYTWWQRSFLHPSLVAFDAPSREEGVCERSRSNTPQQALVLLNDPTYVEAARAFAARMMKEGGATDEARVAWAFRVALARAPQPEETKLLLELLTKHRAEYAADPAAAKALLEIGDSAAPADLPAAELAAWTSAARVLLNLHETITRL